MHHRGSKRRSIDKSLQLQSVPFKTIVAKSKHQSAMCKKSDPSSSAHYYCPVRVEEPSSYVLYCKSARTYHGYSMSSKSEYKESNEPCNLLECVCRHKYPFMWTLTSMFVVVFWSIANICCPVESQLNYWDRQLRMGMMMENPPFNSSNAKYYRLDVSFANPFTIKGYRQSPVDLPNKIGSPSDWVSTARAGSITSANAATSSASTYPSSPTVSIEPEEIIADEKSNGISEIVPSKVLLPTNATEIPAISSDTDIKLDVGENAVAQNQTLEEAEPGGSLNKTLDDLELNNSTLPEIKLEMVPEGPVETSEATDTKPSHTEKNIEDVETASNTTEVPLSATDTEETHEEESEKKLNIESEEIKDTKEKEGENLEVAPDSESSKVAEGDSTTDKTTEPPPLETYSQFAKRFNDEKKNDATVNGNNGVNGNSNKGSKIKTKNYASPHCGSKVVAANNDARNPQKVIQFNKDEYLLNECREKLWFVVELCESVQPQKFDLANFELYSNSPKDIVVSGSHRFPSRDWTVIGKYTGQEGNRAIQSFPIDTNDFFKYIKVEVLSYFGSEFFCPISLFRIYGVSEYEVIEDSPYENEDIDDIIIEDDEKPRDKNGVLPNVLSMFSGVFEVIKRGSWPSIGSGGRNDLSFTKDCRSLPPKYAVDSKLCPLAESINYILSCYQSEYLALNKIPVVANTIKNSTFCHEMSKSLCTTPNINDGLVYDTVCNDSYVCVMLSPKHILAMCLLHDSSLMQTTAPSCESGESAQAENVSSVSDVVSDNTKETKKPEVIEPTKPDKPVKGDNKPSKKINEEKKSTTAEEITQDKSEKVVSSSTTEEKTTNKVESPDTQEKIKKEDDNKEEVKEKINQEGQGSPKVLSEEENVKVDKVEGGNQLNSTEPPTTFSSGQIASLEMKQNTPSHTNKESVIVRLSNKIKALETNMSISSQYLESLSTRYKEQIATMELEIKAAIMALNETARKAHQSDLQHEIDLKNLGNQISNMTALLTQLIQEKDNLSNRVVEQHSFFIVLEIIVITVLFTLCSQRRNAADINYSNSSANGGKFVEFDSRQNSGKDDGSTASSLRRRRSMDSLAYEEMRPRRRRPSEEALNISGTYHDLLVIEPSMPIMIDSNFTKKKKKKKNSLKRSKSNSSIRDLVNIGDSNSISNQLDTSAGVLFYENLDIKNRFQQEHEYLGTGGYTDHVENLNDNAFRPSIQQGDVVDIANKKPKRHSCPMLNTDTNSQKDSTRRLKKSTSMVEKSTIVNGDGKVKRKHSKKSKKDGSCDGVIPNSTHAINGDHASHYTPNYYAGSSSPIMYDHSQLYYDPNYAYDMNMVNIDGRVYHSGYANGLVLPQNSSPYNSYVENTATNYQSTINDDRGLRLSSSTKSKTRLRSDNWEWYATQTPRMSSAETSSASSESSFRFNSDLDSNTSTREYNRSRNKSGDFNKSAASHRDIGQSNPRSQLIQDRISSSEKHHKISGEKKRKKKSKERPGVVLEERVAEGDSI